MIFEALFLAVIGGVVETMAGKTIEGGPALARRARVMKFVEQQELGPAEEAVRAAVEAARQEMLDAYAYTEEGLQPGDVQDLVALLNHPPFAQEVARILLFRGQPDFDRLRQAYLDQDPERSSARWQALEPYLMEFFEAVESHLLADGTLGPLLRDLRTLAVQLRMADDIHLIADAILPMQAAIESMAGGMQSLLALTGQQNATLAQLVELLGNLHSQGPGIVGPPPRDPVAEQAAAVEQRYLEGLYAECNAVPLAGDAPPDAPQQRHPRLQQIYVDLDTKLPLTWGRICDRLGIPAVERAAKLKRLEDALGQEARDRQGPLELLARFDASTLAQMDSKKAGKALGIASKAWRQAIRPVSVLEAIREHPQLVILGDPGSGKSTLTRRLAGVLAAGQLEHLPPDQRDWQAKLAHAFDHWLLPIRVTLSSWAKHLPEDAEGCADDLLDECLRVLGRIARLDGPAQKARLLERINAAQPSVLLLLDGLDEVADPAQRQRLLAAVQHFCTHYPQVPLLVTCRVRPYRERDHYRLPLPEVELAPLREEAIRTFVERWHEELAWAGYYQPESARQAAQRLLGTVFDAQRPELRDMAGTPLLLTMMARVNYDAPLPDSRAELYERFVAKLLWEWEREKLDNQGQSTRLQSLLQAARVKLVGLERALNRLAYSVHGSQGSRDTVDIPRAALREALESIHPGEEAEKAAWAVRVLDLMDDRSGLIIAVEQGTLYRFSHRTFQEYLAARWLATGSDFLDKFKAKMDQEQWREAVFLALGYQVSVRGDYDNALAVFDELMPEEEALAEEWSRALLLGEAYASLQGPEWAGQASEVRRARRVQETAPARLASLLGLEEAMTPPERAEVGNTLARLGDPRPGVGVVVREGVTLPDIDWIPIPPGPFIMGSDMEQDALAYDDERPQFTCRLITAPYRISRYPVSVAQYRCFVEAGGYREEGYWTEAGWAWRVKHDVTGPEDYGAPFHLDNHPVVGVSWYEAVAFCHWLGEALGHQVWLPSEAEWERAARHTDGRLWPWDNDFSPEKCNMRDTGIGATSPVGIFPSGRAECGALDMAGNVWEWCCTRWLDNYEDYEVRVSNNLEGGVPRVVRGGSWDADLLGVRCAFRLRLVPDHRIDVVGFRVVAPGL